MQRALNLAKGSFGLCPDCGRPTFVRRSSLLYDSSESTWVVPHDLLFTLCRGIVKNYRVPKQRKNKPKSKGRHLTCANCQFRVQALHWIEVVDGCVSGPFCKECLRQVTYEVSDERGVRDDLPVYIVSSAKSVLVKARATLLINPAKQRARVSLKDEEAVLL